MSGRHPFSELTAEFGPERRRAHRRFEEGFDCGDATA